MGYFSEATEDFILDIADTIVSLAYPSLPSLLTVEIT
jgi:hypothetical protein